MVVGQTTQTARMLVNAIILRKIHYKALGNKDFARLVEMLSDDLSPLEDLPNYEAHVLNPYKIKYPDAYPSVPKHASR